MNTLPNALAAFASAAAILPNDQVEAAKQSNIRDAAACFVARKGGGGAEVSLGSISGDGDTFAVCTNAH